MSPVRVNVKPSWPDLNLFQTVESGVFVRKSVIGDAFGVITGAYGDESCWGRAAAFLRELEQPVPDVLPWIINNRFKKSA